METGRGLALPGAGGGVTANEGSFQEQKGQHKSFLTIPWEVSAQFASCERRMVLEM